MPLRTGVWLLAVILHAGCASRPPAPVVDRSDAPPPPAEVPVDGLHQVHRGDTLAGIAFKYNLDWRDLANWNGIRSPYTIYPDQVLRLTPPPSSRRSAAVQTRAVPRPRAQTRAVPSSSTQSPSEERTAPPPAVTTPTPAPTNPSPEPVPQKPPVTFSASSGWAWPTEGRVLRGFRAGDASRNGLDIAGREGQPVRATAAGEVVYSGNGLIGYGELVIVKHSDRMLSAYAHNRRRLVAEGERVDQGQAVAELGRNDRREEVLHFEIRRDGKPVDPLEYLPQR